MEKSKVKTILLAGLAVGTLDMLAAIVHFLLNGGKDVIAIFRYIASGVFGSYAFAGGTSMALYGLIFHYMIAMMWTILFFFLYSKISLLSKYTLAAGIVYGLFVWAVMNLVVVPLSNTPKAPFTLTSALIQLGILILAIGLPLSLIADRYYDSRR